MILDYWKNVNKYEGMVNYLQEALAAVEALPELKVGRYEFEHGFFMVQDGETRFAEDGEFEVHRRYVDVQYMYDGCEELVWEEMSNLSESAPFDVEKDFGPMKGERIHRINVTKGMFYIMFPWDGHEACTHSGDQPHHYTKIVIKLPLEK